MSLKTITIQDDQGKDCPIRDIRAFQKHLQLFIVQVFRCMMKMDITLRWMTPSVRRSTNWWKKLTAHTVEQQLSDQLPTRDFPCCSERNSRDFCFFKILVSYRAAVCIGCLFSLIVLTDIPEDCSVIPFSGDLPDELYSTRRQPDHGNWVRSQDSFTSQPVSGAPQSFSVATEEQVHQACCCEAAFVSCQTSRQQRAELLNVIADEIEARGDAITEIGTSETGLPAARLQGERAERQAN